jgi:hypothetical protein
MSVTGHTDVVIVRQSATNSGLSSVYEEVCAVSKRLYLIVTPCDADKESE